IAFSSEYNRGRSWPASNVIGIPRTYPKYGDIDTAWAPYFPHGTKEFLEVEYEVEVFPTGIRIYETFNPGSVVKVSARRNNLDQWEELWSGPPMWNTKKESRILSLELKPLRYPIRQIRVDLDCTRGISIKSNY